MREKLLKYLSNFEIMKKKTYPSSYLFLWIICCIKLIQDINELSPLVCKFLDNWKLFSNTSLEYSPVTNE